MAKYEVELSSTAYVSVVVEAESAEEAEKEALTRAFNYELEDDIDYSSWEVEETNQR